MVLIDQPLIQQVKMKNPLLTARVAWWCDDAALRLIAHKVLYRAVRDAAGNSPVSAAREEMRREAREWLVSEDGSDFILAAGYDVNKVHKWVEDGCSVQGVMKFRGENAYG